VPVVYFDASAFVKLLVEEPATPATRRLEPACLSRGARRSGRHQNGDLDGTGLEQAEESWEDVWAAIRPVELTPAIERHAGELASEHALGGGDAVHLASALAVWDRRLHPGALAASLAVAPAKLEPRVITSACRT